MAKGGRKRSNKPRTPSGQLSRAGARDYGNIRVVERHSRFKHFIDDKGLVHEGTSVGRLWIVGAFDGLGIDAQVLRDHLLDYGRGYWGEWPTTSGTANYLQENRRGHHGGDETTPDPRGERFKAMDAAVSSAGHQARQAVHNAAVDPHFFPDEDRPWIGRVLNSAFAEKIRQAKAKGEPAPVGLSVAGEMACDSDWAMLELLRAGAMALAEGKAQRRAA